MGNSVTNSKSVTSNSVTCHPITDKKYQEWKFEILDNFTLQRIQKEYRVIEIDWLSTSRVKYQLFGDYSYGDYSYFNDEKKDTIMKMVDYYLHHEDKACYKRTDYLCNEDEKVCICNTHADDFRKIYEGCRYEPNKKYISWYRGQIEDQTSNL
jgi:hypothetical protein